MYLKKPRHSNLLTNGNIIWTVIHRNVRFGTKIDYKYMRNIPTVLNLHTIPEKCEAN